MEPAGAVVTLLFTDIVGSTELLSRLGDDAFELVRRKHFRMLGEVVKGAGGSEVKKLGDGLMAVFASAVDAVGCAMAIQRAVARQRLADTEGRIEVRVGLQVGEPIRDEEDYVGTPVVLAKRLCDLASGGQVLTSSLVRDLVGSRSAATFKALGPRTLKGFAEPFEVFEVDWRTDPTASRPPVPAGLRHEGPFVGRDHELATLEGLLKSVSSEGCQVALVGGEAGIGKTRLAAELAARASDACTMLYGRCDPANLIAYQPFVQAFEAHIDTARIALATNFGDISALFPTVTPVDEAGFAPATFGEHDAARYRLFESVRVVLAELGPVLIVLDDLHWADRASLLLLHHLLRTARELPVMVVASYRRSELSRGHPLSNLLADLRRDVPLTRLSLGGLSESDITELLSADPGSEAAVEAVAQAVAEATGGNPYFVIETLRHLQASGVLDQDGRPTTPSIDVSRLEVAEGIRELIGWQLGRLSLAANKVLAVGAVIGPVFTADVVGKVVDLGEDELLDAIDEALDSELVLEEGHRFTFTHALVRETVYAELSTTRRVRLHGRVADALVELSGDQPDRHAAEIAHHYTEAAVGVADPRDALRYAIRAAELARERLAFEQAIDLLEPAIALFPADGAASEPVGTALLLLGDAQRRSGDPRYRQTLARAAAVGRDAGDDTLLAQAALASSRAVFSRTGQVDPELLTLLEETLASLPAEDSPMRAKLLANLAAELLFSGEWDRRLSLADEALAMARRLGDRATLAHVLYQRHDTIWHPSTLDERLRLVSELAEVGDSVRDRYYAALVGIGPALEAGELDLADARIAQASALGDELQEPPLRWFVLLPRATRAVIAGDIEQAEALADEGLRIGTDTGQPDALLAYAGTVLITRLLSRRLDEIDGAYGTAAAEVGDSPITQMMMGWLDAELGRPDDAADVLAQLAADDFGVVRKDLTWLAVIAGCAEMCAAVPDRAIAEGIRDRLLAHRGVFVTVASAAWLGPVDYYLALTEVVLGERDAARDHFDEAEAALDRLAAPAWLARVRDRRAQHNL
jgi:class 3 adenylate cyclase/tetratricopeptide (TPR) repeat protein